MGFPCLDTVKDGGKDGVGEEGEGDGRVLKVAEVADGDGEVVVEGLVVARGDEELRGDVHAAVDAYEGGLELA